MKPALQELYEAFEPTHDSLDCRKDFLETHFRNQRAFVESLNPEQRLQFIRLWDQKLDDLPP